MPTLVCEDPLKSNENFGVGVSPLKLPHTWGGFLSVFSCWFYYSNRAPTLSSILDVLRYWGNFCKNNTYQVGFKIFCAIVYLLVLFLNVISDRIFLWSNVRFLLMVCDSKGGNVPSLYISENCFVFWVKKLFQLLENIVKLDLPYVKNIVKI